VPPALMETASPHRISLAVDDSHCFRTATASYPARSASCGVACLALRNACGSPATVKFDIMYRPPSRARTATLNRVVSSVTLSSYRVLQRGRDPRLVTDAATSVMKSDSSNNSLAAHPARSAPSFLAHPRNSVGINAPSSVRFYWLWPFGYATAGSMTTVLPLTSRLPAP
jgi:hypothetical protein